ncbi:MAG: DNA replication and repair protein RecF [Acidobacteriota bacterium]
MLTSLKLRHFRNLAPFERRMDGGRHLLFGGNGAGKTSVLEAIYLLATTKSFRSNRLSECIQRGRQGFELAAEVDTGVRQSLALEVVAAGDKRRLLNGKAAPLARHLAALPVVSWTAADADLFTGPPKDRRRFLDRGVIGLQATSVAVMSRYREALRQKRRLLAAGGRQRSDLLAPWNDLLAAAGAEIVRRRQRFVARLGAELATDLERIGLSLPAIALDYRPSPPDGADENALRARLDAVEGSEWDRRMSLLGPHRDDLVLRWDGYPLRGSVSAGERKLLGLLIVAAQGRVMTREGPEPVYLLDDLDAELAPSTLAAFWTLLAPVGQLFASSNRPEVWTSLELDSTLRVEAGRVAPGSLAERT